MGYNFNQQSILNIASNILGVSMTAQSMNGRANSLHGRFLGVNKKSSYSNKIDYADAVISYNNVLLQNDLASNKTDSAAIRFNQLIQDPSIYTFFHDFYQSRY